MAVRLKDRNTDVRWGAVRALRGQSVLAGEILKAVAAHVEDQNGAVRIQAVLALGGRSGLPEEILKAVVARLKDQDRDVRRAVVDTLRGQSALSKEVLGQVAKYLYPIWLKESFEEHLSWYVADGISHIDMPVGLRKVRLEDQQDRFRDAIREAQRHLGIPLPDTSGMERWVK
ncbi:hypothetical protein BGZ61DRAFT_478085 [Ilyonectria robusta]|uniref:uncharacterized protein n=1 Tax=Ilyonectria robusta TaxID=1079257 RepID=UPI001E8CFBA4|nr:uncharacterized protein BGZ61DRAFT_478085 [Ilyonectria robusta]KAH8694476.1 hypothetical protein BGZ61DRAFT_478085 [Ilyonectria robusta]